MLARERERDQQQPKACWLLIYWGPQTPKTREEEEEEEEEDPTMLQTKDLFSRVQQHTQQH
jgi:hypothetical protein